MAHSSGSTPFCASGCAAARVGTRCLARPSPTLSPPRAPGSGANRGDSTATRRFGAQSGTYSWTPRVRCSRPRSTALKAARPGWPQAPTGVGAGWDLAPISLVAGCGIRGQGQEVGRAGFGLERGARAQATQARTRGGGQALGAGVGQGGQADRLEKAHAAARLCGPTSQVGGGEDVFVALSEQADEQGLREVVRERGGLRLRGDDPVNGEAVSPFLRISKQFLHALG